jgi:hypothetical protein
MSSDPKSSYKTVGDAINGELGFMDGHFKNEITGHINKIGGSKYLSQYLHQYQQPTKYLSLLYLE